MILLPERSYFLCTMPRSGSTMLCDLLTQTGVAGKPNSFFRPQSMANFAARWDVPAQSLEAFDQDYINTAIDHGTAGTGCFGMRIMWTNNMPGLTKRLGTLFPSAGNDLDRLCAAFGPLKFIHLSRDDKVAEAVSLAMAAQTGLWHKNADGSERERITPHQDPIYDRDLIASEYAEVTAGDAAWRQWFTGQSISPCRVSYEELSADPAGNLAKVLDFLGQDPSAAKGIAPSTAKLATPLSQNWAARFRAEAGIAPNGRSA